MNLKKACKIWNLIQYKWYKKKNKMIKANNI